MIRTLTEKQNSILRGLATYKFLTISQFKLLGIDRHDSNLRKALKPLLESKRKLIGRVKFSLFPRASDLMKKSKLEYVYYLRKNGKKVLVENQLMMPDKIRMPIGTGTMAYRDYFHRKMTINCQIALNREVYRYSLKLLFFDTYFDKIGNNRIGKNLRAKTRIDLNDQKYLIADAVFMLNTKKQKELYCLEVQNGKDTKLTVNKLKDQYIEAISLGSPSDKYKFERSNRVLIVFEHESTLVATLKRLSQDGTFAYMQRHFLFKTLDRIEPFFENWYLINGEIVTLF